jgi:hypothetical protein
MKEDGFIEEAWGDFLSRGATINCDDPTVEGESTDDNDLGHEQLNIKNMGGIFFFHGLLSLLAVVIAVVYRVTGWDQVPRFAKGTSQERLGSGGTYNNLVPPPASAVRGLFSSSHAPFR